MKVNIGAVVFDILFDSEKYAEEVYKNSVKVKFDFDEQSNSCLIVTNDKIKVGEIKFPGLISMQLFKEWLEWNSDSFIQSLDNLFEQYIVRAMKVINEQNIETGKKSESGEMVGDGRD